MPSSSSTSLDAVQKALLERNERRAMASKKNGKSQSGLGSKNVANIPATRTSDQQKGKKRPSTTSNNPPSSSDTEEGPPCKKHASGSNATRSSSPPSDDEPGELSDEQSIHASSDSRNEVSHSEEGAETVGNVDIEAVASSFSLKSCRELARQLCRTTVLFINFKSIFSDGSKRYEAELEGETDEEELNKIMSDRDYATFHCLQDAIPGIHEFYLSIRDNDETLKPFIQMLKDAMSGGRIADTSTIKKYLGGIISYTGVDPKKRIPKGDLPDILSTKHHLGFKHALTGRLLCPADLEWDENLHAQFKSNKAKALASDFPNFCYPTGAYDEKNVANGLFRGSACIKAAQAIFTSPTSIEDTRERSSTKAGNAEKAGIVSMTPRSIAYVLCQLRFGLSNVQAWHRFDGKFNLETFYWNIVDAIEASERFKDELIDYWNMELFQAGTDRKADTESQADDGDEAPSMLSRLRAQRAEVDA